VSEPLHLGRPYFERQYARDPDPWGFESSRYEHAKYEHTIAMLPRARFRRGFEPGCANGVLTARLAARCDELVATEIVSDAAERARLRLAGLGHVTVQERPFPTWWPPGRGDLVVWSEIAYYCSVAGLEVAVDHLDRWLESGGTMLAVHYTGTTDYPLTAHEVHARLDRAPFLLPRARHQADMYEIACWDRTDTTTGRSTPA
jgi:protein-L-isoaspartate O-methyltransferase